MNNRMTRRRLLEQVGLAAAAGAVAAGLPAAVASAHPAQRGPERRRLTVFVAGDSTAALWPLAVAPKAGWGQALPAFLDPCRVKVDDKALSGASSKSFVEVGLLDAILTAIRPRDYLLISFGHNDEKTDDRHTDPYTTFQDYLSLYIDGARQRGAHPVLVTPVERRRFNAEGHAFASHGLYPQAMKDLGAARSVPVIDLTALSMALWEELGVEETKRYFLWFAAGESPNFPDGVADNTHFQARGAIALARIVVGELVEDHILPRADAIRLHRPVAPESLSWPDEVFTPPPGAVAGAEAA